MHRRERWTRRAQPRPLRCGCTIPAMPAAVLVLRRWEKFRENRRSGYIRNRGYAMKETTRAGGNKPDASADLSAVRVLEIPGTNVDEAMRERAEQTVTATVRTLATEEIGKA